MKLKNLISDVDGQVNLVLGLVIAVVVGAMLTGAIGPTAIGGLANATIAGGALGGASATIISAWNTIPTMYIVAFMLIPIALIARAIM